MDESVYIDKVVVGGPYLIPDSELDHARYEVWDCAGDLPGELDLYVDELEGNCAEHSMEYCAINYSVTVDELRAVESARNRLSGYCR